MLKMSTSSLRRHSFSEAKAHLSDVMSEVVRDHAPTLIERHGGKETMLLLDTGMLEPLLASFRFSTKVSLSGGGFVLRQPELGLVADGETFDEAANELEELAVQYAADFFERWDFYRHTDRVAHLPYLLRLALAVPDERRALLVPKPEASPAR